MTGAATKQDTLYLLDVHAATEPAFAVDMRARISAWNEAAVALLGVPAAEALGAPCSEVMGICHGARGGACPAACAAVANARRGRPTHAFEVALTTRQGDPRWIEISTILAYTGHGSKRAIHFLHDTTEHHRRDEQLARAMAHARQGALRDAPPGALAPDAPAQPARPPQLTHRERDVLRLIAGGMATHQVAQALSISPLTARNHVANVMDKLGVASRLQAVIVASQLGLL